MKTSTACGLLLLIFGLTAGQIQAQTKEFPVIKNGGGVFPVPEAVAVADPSLAYKIVAT